MEVRRLFDTLYYQAKNFPKKDAIASKRGGKWVKYSTEKIIETSCQLSHGLLKLGLKKGDKVGIISFNCPEWVMADVALSQLGIITVPMYPNATFRDYEYIIKDAEIKLIFVGDAEIYDKVLKACDGLDLKESIYSFEKLDKVQHWSEIQALGADGKLAGLKDYMDAVQPEELATLIYTSGTTGNPKGVMLSHHNIISNTKSVAAAFKIERFDYRSLSFLPLCHIFERTAVSVYLYESVSIYFAESMDTIADNLREVRPHLFSTVPRLLEKVYERIIKKGYELKGFKKNLFFWALKLGQRYEIDKDKNFWYGMQMKLADKLIFSKWRDALGGNIEFIVSGAAALQPRLVRIFWAAGIKVTEAYGMTETSPGISFTRVESKDARIGCVGPLLKDVYVKFADDGEILVKGSNVMMGYYKRPELRSEVFDEEGWFRTGDIGEMVEGRFLKITDRKKQMFKTSGGKYIAPQRLENKFKESMLIEHIMVVGEGEKFPAAFIIPSFENLRQWCELHHIDYTDDCSIIFNEKVIEKYDNEVQKYNADFARYEQIKKFKLLSEPWSIDTGELTPTLKLKRKVILQRHTSDLEAFYPKG